MSLGNKNRKLYQVQQKKVTEKYFRGQQILRI